MKTCWLQFNSREEVPHLMTSLLEARVRGRLSAAQSAGLSRHLRNPSGIDLCSNDYLGLASDGYLRGRMAVGAELEGCGSTGSRLLRGQRTVFLNAEKRFAEFKGTEAALYFGSGYAANLAVLSTFPERGDMVFSDQLNHASLIDGMRLSHAERTIFPHAGTGTLRQSMQSTAAAGHCFLVTESVFSMDGDFAPLAEYAKICRESGAAVIVDEAHAVGIHGARGSGLVEAAGIAGDVFLSINPAGKALGVGGAFVAGPAWAIDYMIQYARPFIFSTAPPPSMAYALDAALDLIGSEPERRSRVLELTAFLRALLTEIGISAPPGGSQIIPVHLGDNTRATNVAGELQSAGFDVRAIRPPTVPQGTARVRISVNSELREPDLRRFVHSLAAAMRKYPEQ
jgi:8-amino-7-oxononanoate synthase